MVTTLYMPIKPEIYFVPVQTFTAEEICLGYTPNRNDWQTVISDPKAFAKLLRKRKLIAFGVYGAVYDVDGAAIKIGCIGESEPAIQQWVYKYYQRALPVWAFSQAITLPKAVTHEVCPRHGYLSELWTSSSVVCHCSEPMSVLVMPVANRADQSADRDESIGNQIYEAVFKKFGICLDLHKNNYVEFKGKLMLCDFGDPNGRVADYW